MVHVCFEPRFEGRITGDSTGMYWQVAAGGLTFELQTIIKLGIFAVPNADDLAVHEPRPRGLQKNRGSDERVAYASVKFS